MDLRQLRYFVAVAERGGCSAAASTLNVAQSALSRHIKLLEHELGGALFERGARGVAVTESGKVLLTRRRWLWRTLDEIKAEIVTENRAPGGRVRLGAPSTLADNFYAPLACLFAERFPRVKLELSEGLTEEMTDRLLRGELDLAIVTAPRPNDHLDYQTLVVEQVFLIGPPHDARVNRGALTRQDFNQLPAVVLALRFRPAPVAAHGRVFLRQEQQVELGGGAVERAARHADDVGHDEAVVTHEAHDVVDFRTAFDTGDGAGLDNEGVDAVHPAGHAFEHHQLGTLDVDLGECRPGDLADQRVEAADRHAVMAQDFARRDVLQQGRALDVRADLDHRLALAVAQRQGMDLTAQQARELAHVVQRFASRIDQVIVGVGKCAVELVGAVAPPHVQHPSPPQP